MLPRMNSSVKFLEPTVIGGVEPAPLTGWICPEELPDEVEPELELELLSLLDPQAASTRAAARDSTAAERERRFMGNFLLVVGGRLRPCGVTARCSPANRPSHASASAATRMAPPSRPASP